MSNKAKMVKAYDNGFLFTSGKKSKMAFEMHVNICHFLKLKSGSVPFDFR